MRVGTRGALLPPLLLSGVGQPPLIFTENQVAAAVLSSLPVKHEQESPFILRKHVHSSGINRSLVYTIGMHAVKVRYSPRFAMCSRISQRRGDKRQ